MEQDIIVPISVMEKVREQTELTSLIASREMITNMIEIHGNATVSDAGVFLASCDKGMPANLMGLCRLNIPAIVVPGGTMNAGPDMLTLEQLGMYSAKFQRGEIDEDKLNWAKHNACPSCGACSFIGTASTMQDLWQKHLDLHFRVLL